ncbi:hypothetical protein GGI25_001453 [Coemansia spiralis]|uniref:S1 motif domain-containing protein n=2 Tax=Coemansia TaxID=4863 RepID=A0A9W8G5M7_9FUNG|nr:eukaryotic translation initiation factor 2 alpha subunit-domain-containing protein [Coemansia spiralis]KAJ1994794.1 hypothetical protein EDC05_001417 [Coemansia umbellata]KAJ2624504.1 hypothetical protein GGI26_001422 [Coemansia sp. RSA 1358]KAJ2679530.1 hypothetical protein GGI25_001453 [Coemansia spiralis]
MDSLRSLRFYRDKYPEVNDIVFVKVEKIEKDIGVHVKLVEYGNIDGIIYAKDVSKNRIRSLFQLFHAGHYKVVVVNSVDAQTGYVDLSLAQVKPEDISVCEDRFQKAMTVQSITNYVATKMDVDFEELCEKVTWPLYDKYGHAYDAFKKAIVDPSVFDEFGLDNRLKTELVGYIVKRLELSDPVVEAKVSVQSVGFDGIGDVKKALKAAEAVSNEDASVKIYWDGAPIYRVVVSRTKAAAGMELARKAMDATKDAIESMEGGSFSVIEDPKPFY